MSFKTELRVAASVSPLNGKRPVIISYSTTPKENKSDRWSTSLTWICSGDIYPIVPSVEPDLVSFSLPWIVASPKSSNFGRPSASMTILDDLMSR